MAVPETPYVWIGAKHFTVANRAPVGVVIHWSVTSDLTAIDNVFNGTREASAHYGVGDSLPVHQYVRERDIAWHAGDWAANQKYLGVEHVGGWGPDPTANPPSRATLENSAWLLAYFADKYGWGELRRGVNVFLHNQFTATMCPGNTDVAWLIARANEILRNGGPQIPTPEPDPEPTPEPAPEPTPEPDPVEPDPIEPDPEPTEPEQPTANPWQAILTALIRIAVLLHILTPERGQELIDNLGDHHDA
jgi:hypothetical protein